MPPSPRRRLYSNPCIRPLQVSSTEDTPNSSAQLSPTVDLAHEYTLAIHTNSYNEIWSKIHHTNSSYREPELRHGEVHEEQNLSNPVLNPSRECVQEALQNARSSTLTRLVSAYFDHSENTSHLCLLLHDSVNRARTHYLDIHTIIDFFPLDSDAHSLTESQCNWAFNIFLEFDRFENPFPRPGSQNFHEIRHCFSQLNQQLHHRLRKCRSRVRCLHLATSCSTTCFIGPLFPSLHPSRITKNELAHLSQLDAAAKGTYVLHNNLDTIDRLVDRLYSSVEGDKFLVRLGLERGQDRHPIHEVAKQLQKNHHNFISQLVDLEEHICLCLATINRARSLLLEVIFLHQSSVSN